MNPRDVTRREFGAFLEAVGREMRNHDLSVGAALDGLGDQNMLPYLAERLELPANPAVARAAELLSLDVDDIQFLLENQE